MLIVNIVGAGRESGKTELITALTRKLSEKGFKVSVIKHIATSSFDTPEKDTWRHLEAGSQSVLAVTSREIVKISRPMKPSLEEALAQVPGDTDFVLIEGFKESSYPKIVVGRTAKDVEDVLKRSSNIFAVSTFTDEEAAKLKVSIPKVKPEDLLKLLMERHQRQSSLG